MPAKSITKIINETTMYSFLPLLTPKYIPTDEQNAIITPTMKYGDVR